MLLGFKKAFQECITFRKHNNYHFLQSHMGSSFFKESKKIRIVLRRGPSEESFFQ